MTKILITGGTGFLGSHLCRRLAADGKSLTVLHRASARSNALTGLDIRHEISDVMDSASVARAVKGHDVVIHAAAGLTGSGGREQSYDVNVTGTRNVVEACVTNGVRRLLHVSSVAAIGIPEDDTPADETFRFNLDGSKLHYHVSKFRAERVAAEVASRGLQVVIVNPASIWGPFDGTYRGSAMVRAIRHARVVRTSPGGMCIVHVHDVVDGIVAALERGEPGHRYILGGENISYRDWTARIARAVSAHPLVVTVPKFVTASLAVILKPLSAVHPRFHGSFLRSYLAGRSAFYDSSKAVKALGYRPRGFDKILEESIGFFQASQRSGAR